MVNTSGLHFHLFNFPESIESEIFKANAHRSQDLAQVKKRSKTQLGWPTDVFFKVPGVLAKVGIGWLSHFFRPTTRLTIQIWTYSPERFLFRLLLPSVHLSDVPKGDRPHRRAGAWWAGPATDHHVSSLNLQRVWTRNSEKCELSTFAHICEEL